MYIIVYGFASHASRSFRRVQTQLPCTAERVSAGQWEFFFFQGFLFHMDLGILKIPRSIGGVRSPGYGTQTKLIHHNKGFMGGCSSIFAYLF
jgi:hypothetical protein